MSLSFARYFKLKESERDSFRLDPNKDAALYVDLDGVISRLRNELNKEAPQFVVQGDFGMGKSHILRHVEHHLVGTKFRPVYLLLSGFQRRSDFYLVHRAIINQLIPLIRSALELPTDRRPNIRAQPLLSEDMCRALSNLTYKASAEQWLSDSRVLTKAKAAKEGYGGTLTEKAQPADLIGLYKAISETYYQAFGQKLLLLIDEAESFARVLDPDAQASIGAGMRGFFDAENKSIGLFLGLNTPQTRGTTHPMLRSDVRSRVGDRRVELKPLNTTERIHSFIIELWPKLVDSSLKTGMGPFFLDQSALNLLENRLEDLRKQIYPEEELAPSPTPRDLLEVLTKIGEGAVQTQQRPPLGASLIEKWFGLGGT